MTPFRYECSECGRSYARDEVRYLCLECGLKYRPGEPLRGVLLARFEGEELRRRWNPRQPDWDLFLAVEAEHYPPFAVGRTPLVRVARLGRESGFGDLWVKNDGLNPSGSLKDRASFLVAAEAIRLGERKVVTASTGNAASALAAVCAAAGLQAVIFVPAAAPRAKLVQMVLYGAKVIPVLGTYDDAFRASLEYTGRHGGLNRNTAYHPLTIEGKKTAGLEIFAQNGARVPDAILVPVGDGVIIAGVWKAFHDLKEAGLAPRLPRLIAVQAETSDAIHHLVTTGEYRNAPAPDTVADSISVSAPSNAWLAARAIRESGGFSVTVSDAEMLDAQARLARASGIFAEPAAAAVAAALPKIKAGNLLNAAGQIVLLVTGHGLKNIEAPLARITLPPPVPPEQAAEQGGD